MAFDTLNDPNIWSQDSVTPPEAWEANTPGWYGWNGNSGESGSYLVHEGANALPTTLRIKVNILTAPSTGYVRLAYDSTSGTKEVNLGASTGQQTVVLTDHQRTVADEFRWKLRDNGDGSMLYGTIADAIECTTDYNCARETDENSETLGNLRTRVAKRAGYATQASNLPSGVSAMIDEMLISAQRALYQKFKSRYTRRFFTWALQEDGRYYDVQANMDCATVNLNRYRIHGAWIEDQNGAWFPLRRGIDPQRYTVDTDTGYPDSFDVRECIEIFPAPQSSGFRLYILGDFGLGTFASASDSSTIDGEAIFNYALGLYKLHKGDRDAGDPSRWTGYFGVAREHILELVSGGHQGERYIPGRGTFRPPARPTLTSFIN